MLEAPPLDGFATPERRLIFHINDLDETLPAPWERDVERLASNPCR
jgi:uncharacterized protein (DUF2252 family)